MGIYYTLDRFFYWREVYRKEVRKPILVKITIIEDYTLKSKNKQEGE
jgi:hypothetical protein